MITSFLLTAFVAILNFIATPLVFLPDAAFDPNIAAALGTATANIKGVFAIAPLTEAVVFSSFAAILVIEGALAVYKAIMWGIKKIPTIS